MLLAVLVVTDNEFQTVGAALGQTDEDSSSLSGRDIITVRLLQKSDSIRSVPIELL